MVKIEFTLLSLDRKIFPFKKGFKKWPDWPEPEPEPDFRSHTDYGAGLKIQTDWISGEKVRNVISGRF